MGKPFQQYLVDLVHETSPEVKFEASLFCLVPDNAKQPSEALLQSLGGETRKKLRGRLLRNKRYADDNLDCLQSSSDHATCASDHSNSSLLALIDDDSDRDQLDFDSSFEGEEFGSSLLVSRWESNSEKSGPSSSGSSLPSMPQRTPPITERKMIGSPLPTVSSKSTTTKSEVGDPRNPNSASAFVFPPVLPRSLSSSLPLEVFEAAEQPSRNCSSVGSPTHKLSTFQRRSHRKLFAQEILTKALQFACVDDDEADSLEGSSRCYRTTTTSKPKSYRKETTRSQMMLQSSPPPPPPPPPSSKSLSSPSPSISRGRKSPRNSTSPRKTSPRTTSHRKTSSLSSSSSSKSSPSPSSTIDNWNSNRRPSKSPPSPALGKGQTRSPRRQRSQRTLVVVDKKDLRGQCKE
jgi:hypothetical protein